MKKFSRIPESLDEMTFSQFTKLLKFEGGLVAELVELWSGMDFDMCLNYVEQHDMTWIDADAIMKSIQSESVPESVSISDIDCKVKSDLMEEWFGLKMVTSGLLSTGDDNRLDVIPAVLANYFCQDVYAYYSQKNVSELTEIISEMPANIVYPLGLHYAEMIAKLNEYQSNALVMDEGYRTQQGREKRNLMQSFGVQRLERFGDMNLIDDFCTAFQAYRHDDVFKLEFAFVIDRLSRIEIINNLTEQLTQHYHDQAKKQ